MKLTKRNLIDLFFAELVLGYGNWRTAVTLNQEQVIATSESAFADTWTIIHPERALEGLKILAEEIGDETLFADEIDAITSAKGIKLRSVVLKNLETAIRKTEPDYFENVA